MEIGTKLIQKRKELRLSQLEVAEYVGVSQSTYCLWEADKQRTPFDHLAKLSEILKIPMSELIPEGTIIKIMDNQHQKNGGNAVVGFEVKMDARELYDKLMGSVEENNRLLRENCELLKGQIEELRKRNEALERKFVVA